MFKFLWVFFVSLILWALITFVNFKFWNNYLSFFINEQIINAILTIIGFNSASIVFLVSQITSIELDKWISFKNSKTEIFHNFIWMIIIFLIEFLIISSYKFQEQYKNVLLNSYDFIYFSIILWFFLVFLYLFFEILNWIIHLSKNNK